MGVTFGGCGNNRDKAASKMNVAMIPILVANFFPVIEFGFICRKNNKRVKSVTSYKAFKAAIV
jgi:hypothetical protein